MSRAVFIAFMLASVGTNAGCRVSHPETARNVVAVVGGETINLEDFRREYTDHLLGNGLSDDLRRRYAFLNRMVGMKLLALQARQDGSADTDAYRYREQAVSKKLMMDLLLERTVFDRMRVSEAELKEMMVRINTRTKARHLHARSLAEAELLHGRLMAGERYEDLARDVFDDPILSSNGGSLGYFSFDEMDPDFEDAAFDLRIGEISTPIRTSQGYSIVQVEDRFVKPIFTEMDYAARKGRLETYVRERKRKAARKAYLKAILDEAMPEFDENTMALLFGTISGARLRDSGENEDELLGAALVDFTSNGRSLSLNVRMFREQAALASAEQRRAVRSVEDLKAFITGLVVRSIMVERAETLELDSDPSFRKALAHEMASWLYERAYNSVVEAIEIEPDTIENYFRKYRSEFMQPERVRVREILVASADEAELAMQAISKSPFSNVARDYSIRPGSDETGGDLGPVTRKQLGFLADAVFDGRTGDTIGPIAVDDRYVILQVGEAEPQREASLEEVRAEIEQLIRQQRKQSVLRQRIEDLKGRFKIEFHRARIDTMNLTAHVTS